MLTPTAHGAACVHLGSVVEDPVWQHSHPPAGPIVEALRNDRVRASGTPTSVCNSRSAPQASVCPSGFCVIVPCQVEKAAKAVRSRSSADFALVLSIMNSAVLLALISGLGSAAYLASG